MNTELKLPPHSVDSEQSALGALMMVNDAIDRVEFLRPEMFFREDHRLIFEAIQSLLERSTPADVLTVSEQLGKRGQLDRVGGLAYLAEIANGTPSAANIVAYARRVRETAVERSIIAACDSVIGRVYQPGELTEKLDYTQQQFAALDAHSLQREPSAVRDVVKRHIEVLQQRMAGDFSGVTTGFTDIDKRLRGLRNGNVIIVAARPAMGKSTFAMNVSINVAELGLPVLFCSQEMPEEDLADRALSQVGRIPMDSLIAGELTDEDWDRLTTATQRLSEMPLFLDEQPALTLWDVRAKARKIKRTHGLALIVIDYLQLMVGKGESRTQEVGAISRGIKQLAKDMGCPVVLLSQLNRGLESRPNKRPLLSDLRDSGEIEQDADVVIFLYRDEVYFPDSPDAGLAEAIIAKARQGKSGGACVRLAFDGAHSAFRDASFEAIQASIARAKEATAPKNSRGAKSDRM